jgi:predicted nuclease with TOPRIM domain
MLPIVAIALDTLEYARRLQEAGFSEQQAYGQAQALAAAMTDTLATKQDLRELEARIDARLAQVDARFVQVDSRLDHLERHFDTRLAELEKRVEIRLDELEKRMDLRFSGRMADLERRLTMRMGAMTLAGITAVSAIAELL